MDFNSLDDAISCPVCGARIVSGIGFRLGAINGRRYRLGEELDWSSRDPETGEEAISIRPSSRPQTNLIKTIGYFNCDDIKCDSWQDCFPEVQSAIITIRNNKLESAVACLADDLKNGMHDFAIIEPAELADH